MNMQRHSFRAFGHVAAIGAALLAASCAPTPDLGRYQPDRWTALKSVVTGEAVTPPLAPTAAEANMRAGAEAIRRGSPVLERNLVTRVSEKIAPKPEVAPSLVYYDVLRDAHPTSMSSLVNALGDDVQIDTVRLTQFVASGTEVIRVDAMRAATLVGAPNALTTVAAEDPAAFRYMRERLNENGDVLDEIFSTMLARIISYRTALAHARVDADETVTLDQVARAIRIMDDELTRLDYAARRHKTIRLSLSS
tara:strand:- start:460 stop:1212 length:753 start_codon:yes stop_codon:yes gene_type:complete